MLLPLCISKLGYVGWEICKLYLKCFRSLTVMLKVVEFNVYPRSSYGWDGGDEVSRRQLPKYFDI